MEILIFVALIAVAIIRNRIVERQNAEKNRPVFEEIPHIDEDLIKPYESSEGTESNEGKCIEPNPVHCAVEHFEDSVYESEIGSQAPDTSREELIKAIIMSEIISKPKSLQ